MSGAPQSSWVSSRMQQSAVVLVAVGVVASAVGFVTTPERAWTSFLLHAFYIASLGVSAAFFASTQRLTGARWSAALRRIPEAFMLTLPLGAALMLVVLVVGGTSIYPWAVPGGLAHEPQFAGKIWFLQSPFVLVRMVIILTLWNLFAFLYRKISLAQDGDPTRNLVYHRRLNQWAGVFAVVFTFSFTAAANDWLLSLEPSWFSTLYAVYVFAGTFVQGIAAIACATVLLRGRKLLHPSVGDDQLHDLGKLLFAFSTFWAYLWVAQYLLIWYGDIPEEVTWYVSRTSGPWLVVFLANLIVNWVLPFCILMSVKAKKNPRILLGVSVLVLVGHWLDLYILIVPAKSPAPHIGLVEVGMALASAALVFLVVVKCLARAPLCPVNDAMLRHDAS